MSFEPRARGRAASPRTQAPETTTADDGDWAKSGAAGIQRAEQVAQEQARRLSERAQGNVDPNDLWRFRLQVGEEADIVILDAQIEDLRFYHEHKVQDERGNWNHHELCPKEWEVCPLCESTRKESYYVMFLTVLDLRGFTPERGPRAGQFVPYAKRLMPVINTQISDFVRLFDAAKQQSGTFRGMHLVMSRDASVPYAIGKPVMLDEARMFEIIGEDELVSEWGHAAEMGDDGETVIKIENADITAYPYGKIFKKPAAEDLRRRYGGQAPAGSRQSNEEGGWNRGGNGGGNQRPGTRQQGGQTDEWGAPPGGLNNGGQQRGGDGSRFRSRAAGGQQAPATQQGGEQTRGRARPTGGGQQAPAQGGRARSRVQPGATGRSGVPNDLDDNIPF